jgi:hypothetical protein
VTVTLPLSFILDGINKENYKIPEEIIMVEKSDMKILMKYYFGRDY